MADATLADVLVAVGRVEAKLDRLIEEIVNAAGQTEPPPPTRACACVRAGVAVKNCPSCRGTGAG